MTKLDVNMQKIGFSFKMNEGCARVYENDDYIAKFIGDKIYLYSKKPYNFIGIRRKITDLMP